MKNPLFPSDFLFGVATSSYQVEGAAFEDGRTAGIWDDYSKVPGRVRNQENGNIAVDHYHRYKDDIALMAELGFKAYRFSISWPRVLPNGGNRINRKGIEFYRNICEELHKYGMKACCTIYHWDLPSELQKNGGWANRETAYAYQNLAKVMFSELGDLVDMWITTNEPFCITTLSYLYGLHAPGLSDAELNAKAIHHVNLAHGLALEAYRKTGLKAPIGISVDPKTPIPASNNIMDKLACDQKRAAETEVYVGPMFGKGYPKYVTEVLGWKFPIQEGDMELISGKIDFLGINYYNEQILKWSDSDRYNSTNVDPGTRHTAGTDWPVTPDGLYRQLMFFKEYTKGTPIYITENGSAEGDILDNNAVHDTDRIEYIDLHLKAMERAIQDGVPLKGYFYWSFIDNYEWTLGYAARFGLVYCDYKTLKRIPKDSALHFKAFLEERESTK